MRPVILISSCRKDAEAGNNQVIRDTWGKTPTIPVFFIHGEPFVSGLKDEIILPVKDDYFSLCYKTRDGHAWARKQGYDWCFQAFTDTFIDTNRLIASDFTRADFIGNHGLNGCRGYNFCHGDPGYWLSPRASDIIIASTIGKENLEDQWVAFQMKSHGIVPTDDKRYSMGTTYSFHEAVPQPNNAQISCHLSDSGHKYTKDMMITAWKRRFPVLSSV